MKPQKIADFGKCAHFKPMESAEFPSLHKEICDFYEFVRPRSFEHHMRTDLLGRLEKFILEWDSTCEVRSFGSFAAGLYLPNSDMDVVVLSKQFLNSGVSRLRQSSKHLHTLGYRLERCKLALPGSVEIIAKAKVPLVKFVDSKTSLRVDLSFENITGPVANQTFQEWKAQFPAMPVIVTIIKQFLLMRGLNEVVNGGIGGFTVTCLVTSLLQNMTRIQSGVFKPEDHLGEVLIEFLDLYGNQFDLSRVALSVNPPGFLEKVRESEFVQ